MNVKEYHSFVGCGPEDAAALRDFWPHVAPEAQHIVDGFYERVTQHPSTRDIMTDPAQVERLKRTLKVWLKELFNGPWDAEYVKRRQRIGQVHVRVGVSHMVMFMAMTAMQEDLKVIARAAYEAPETVVDAIRKSTMLDLALMTDTFHAIESTQRVRDARMLMIAHLPTAALLLDANGNVASSTSAASWLFAQHESPHTHFTACLPPVLLEKANLTTHIQTAMTTRERRKIGRIEVDISGEPRHLSMTLVPLEVPDAGLIIYLQDHTTAVEADRRAQHAEHLAQIGTLTTTLAHEIRNPLAGISGALQIIRRKVSEDERTADVIDRVLKQVRGLNNLATDLLAYARPTRLRTENGIDLAKLCQEVADGLLVNHPDIDIDVSGTAHARVDPELVTQILVNLGINACEAMGKTGTLTFDVSDNAICVCDSGPGVPDSVLDRMFEPFFTTKIKGTGLGLSVSAKLARAMGGTLTYSSTEQEGSCFRLTLRREATES